MLIRLLRRYLRPYRGMVVLAGLLQLVEVVAMLLLPTLNASIIDRGVVAGDQGHILWMGALMVLVAAAAAGAGIGSVLCGARAALSLGRDLRSEVFYRGQGLSTQQVERIGGSSLTTRSTNDVQQVETVAFDGLTALAAVPAICLGSVALALSQDVPLSFVLLAFIPVIIVLVWVAQRRLTAVYGRIQSAIDRLNRIVGEQVSGARVVRAFARDAHERERFGRTNAELLGHSLRAGRLFALMFPAVSLASGIGTVAVVWLGAVRVDGGEIGIGTVNAFVEYLVYITWSITMATFVFLVVPRASVSARRIREVLDTEPDVTPPVPARTGRSRGTLLLRGVTYRYPGAELPSVHGVDLRAGPGETVAVIGSTGSGKTTLLNLVLRGVDVTEGAVLVNGVDVRELDPEELTVTVGVVPQRAQLFSGTVAANLRFGDPDATDAELWRALDVAQARELVENLPGGLAAEIAGGGADLSGGQRQRITIARTLVRRPPVYLFDDCFSALDPATEAALLAALRAETASATVLVVAQRVSTVRHADRIVVLDEGRVVGSGPHEELLATCEIYRDIASSQQAGMGAR
ncbi:ABC transporter ATP-binding protein [Saccharopolyspora sp. NFXS83]|uniref:ABC transporter ATP-binding protein n=1 Tax=Saccharopolyspora sp. NFXS83 TaxID=2993560 RepID=UPI00224A9722|nr:ABC transporter ATP-binding protein [Saccharopolyspora sp. NFXS83]MCX2731048.1 ABC transporter ATP-binding protein [Saccharopolyspora sp. NFXS83]